MTDYIRQAGATSASVVVFIFDPATGIPDTTVVYSNAALVMQYRREGAASTEITEVNIAALTTGYTSSGFLHIGNGYYRLDLPDAAVAAGVSGVQVHGALTDRAIVGCYVHLVAYNPTDAVRLGLTSLPNVASGSAGAIPTTGTGANQISVTSGAVALGTGGIATTTFAAGAINAAAIADGAIDAATFAAGAINAAAIATDAIDDDALAANAVSAIQSGLSTLGMATALPGTPTADTVGDALKRSSMGIPLSAAGETGGLATYDNVNAGVIFGTVTDATPAAGNFTGDSGLEDTTDDYYTGRFLIFTSNDLGARKISSYTATSRTFEFLGTPATDADAPFDAAPANGATFIIFGFHGA